MSFIASFRMADVENITVAVRSRPLSSKEVCRGCVPVVVVDEKTIRIMAPSSSSSSGGSSIEEKNFTFDFCYDELSEQKQVYEELGEPMLRKALDGYNATIFAYGQTGNPTVALTLPINAYG